MKIGILMCAAAVALAPAAMLVTSAAAQAQAAPAGRSAAPAIDGLQVETVNKLEQGVTLHFSLYGTPGAAVTLSIAGANRAVHLREVEPGQYSGDYVIGNRDRLQPNSRVSAEMRLGNQVATSVLRTPLALVGPAPSGLPATKDPRVPDTAPGVAPPDKRQTERPRVARYCTSCAIVEKVEVVQGPVANPRPLASEVQSRQYHRVTVRFTTTDTTQSIDFENNPGYRKGDRVRVNEGVLSLDQL